MRSILALALLLVLALALPPTALADIDHPPGGGPVPADDGSDPGNGKPGWTVEPEPLDPLDAFPKFGIDAFLWVTGYKGKFERERNDSGSEFHTGKSDLGLENPVPSFSARAHLTLNPDFVFELEYALMYMRDDHGLPRQSIVFDGDFIPAGTPLETRVQVEFGSLQAGWSLSRADLVYTRFLFGATVFEQRVRFKNLVTLEESREASDQYTPHIGFQVGGDYKWWGWDVRAKLFGYATNKDRFGFWDFETLVHVKPNDHVNMHVGIRHVSVDYHNEDGDGDTTSDFNLFAVVMGIGFQF